MNNRSGINCRSGVRLWDKVQYSVDRKLGRPGLCMYWSLLLNMLQNPTPKYVATPNWAQHLAALIVGAKLTA